MPSSVATEKKWTLVDNETTSGKFTAEFENKSGVLQYKQVNKPPNIQSMAIDKIE